MSLTPSHAEQEVLADTLRRDGSSMTGRQLFAALAPATLFTLARQRGVHAAALLIVSDQLRPARVRIEPEALTAAERRLGAVAVEALATATAPAD